MKRWINDIVNLFYPGVCHVCGENLSPHERFACTRCLNALPRTGYHRNPMNPMEERFAGLFPFEKATGHFFYSRDSALATLIQDMKYRGYPSIGVLLGKIAGSELYTTGFLSDIDKIVPVPMHFWKKAKRGYNQTDHIAEGMSDASGIPVVNALKMTRPHKTQTALSHLERLDNADNLFDVKRGCNLSNNHILLIDDVCTTGATLGSAAKAIIEKEPTVKISLMSLGVTF